MTREQYIVPVARGTLIQLKLGEKKIINATSALSFKMVSIPANQVGLIVAAKIWPDETWPNREHYQESAPYYKVLFERDIVLVSERNIPSSMIEIVRNGNS